MQQNKLFHWACLSLVTGLMLISAHAKPAGRENLIVQGRWSAERANAYYAKYPWLIGCNYIPATAINQIEMWQAESFDPKTIAKELDMAQALGYNLLRVFLHNLVWQADEKGLYDRMDQFLTMTHERGMSVDFVFFDDCHHPFGKVGPQPLPVPEYHNSGWLNCPTRDVGERYSQGKSDAKEVANLKGYIQSTMSQFKDDQRIFMWELYNEPGRGAGLNGSMEGGEGEGKGNWGDESSKLLLDTWQWAREVAPSQPICSTAEGSVGKNNIAIAKLNSDIASFHSYSPPVPLEKLCKNYKATGRPAVCTEVLKRPESTPQKSLPILKEYKIGAVCWGFVAGKTGTIWPWASRKGKDVDQLRAEGHVIKPGEPFPEPKVWFHDLYRIDGTPFDPSEIQAIKQLTGKAQTTEGR